MPHTKTEYAINICEQDHIITKLLSYIIDGKGNKVPTSEDQIIGFNQERQNLLSHMILAPKGTVFERIAIEQDRLMKHIMTRKRTTLLRYPYKHLPVIKMIQLLNHQLYDLNQRTND